MDCQHEIADYAFSMNVASSLAEPLWDHESYSPPPEVAVIPTHVRSGARIPSLYAAGDVSLLDRFMVAIIGSRRASARGLELAGDVARECVMAGMVVVSGLAAGIDSAAHRAAITAGGRTIGVVGTPLDCAFPASGSSPSRGGVPASPAPFSICDVDTHAPRVLPRCATA